MPQASRSTQVRRGVAVADEAASQKSELRRAGGGGTGLKRVIGGELEDGPGKVGAAFMKVPRKAISIASEGPHG